MKQRPLTRTEAEYQRLEHWPIGSVVVMVCVAVIAAIGLLI